MFELKARWLALAVSFVAIGSAVLWFGTARQHFRTLLAAPAQAIAAEQSSTAAKGAPGSASTGPEALAQASEGELNAAWEDLFSVLPPTRLTREQPTGAESTSDVLMSLSNPAVPPPQSVVAPLGANPPELESQTGLRLEALRSAASAPAGTVPDRAPNAGVKATISEGLSFRTRPERRTTARAHRERNASAEVSTRETIPPRRRAERLEAGVQAPHQRKQRKARLPQVAAGEERRTAMLKENMSPAIRLPEGLIPSHARQ
jgi:hypothetical protein